MKPEDNANVIVDTVRRDAYAHFLALQLAPHTVRPALYALTALHCELAHVADHVREPIAGHMRLVWWRDALTLLGQENTPIPAHPVLRALHTTCLPWISELRPLWLAMVHARAMELETAEGVSEKEFANYMEGTVGNLQRTWYLVLGCDEATWLSNALAWGELELAYALPKLFSRNRALLPVAWLQGEDFSTWASAERASQLSRLLALRAEAIWGMIPSRPSNNTKPLRALQCLAHYQFRQLKKASYNPYTVYRSRFKQVCCILRLLF